jgi:hypothetical protein
MIFIEGFVKAWAVATAILCLLLSAVSASPALPVALDAATLDAIYYVANATATSEFLRAFEVAFWQGLPLPSSPDAYLTWFEGRATTRLAMGRGRDSSKPIDAAILASGEASARERRLKQSARRLQHEGHMMEMGSMPSEMSSTEESATAVGSELADVDPRAQRMRVHRLSVTRIDPDDQQIWSEDPNSNEETLWRFSSWRTIPGSETASYYAKSLKSGPLRGLVIHWTATSEGGMMSKKVRPDILLVAPDLVPPCIDEWQGLEQLYFGPGAPGTAARVLSGRLTTSWRDVALSQQRPSSASSASSSSGRPPHSSPSTPSYSSPRWKLNLAATESFKKKGGRHLQSATASTATAPLRRAPEACYLPGVLDRTFPTKEESKRVMLEELSVASAGAYSNAQVELPATLRRRLSSLSRGRRAQLAERHSNDRLLREQLLMIDNHAGASGDEQIFAAGNTSSSSSRSLYISPSDSRGARTMLIARVKFNGQADSVVLTETQAKQLMENLIPEYNRAAMGKATFTYTLASGVINLGTAVTTCTDDVDLIWSTAKTKVLAATGLDSAKFNHFVLLPPYCDNWGFSGIAYQPGTEQMWVDARPGEAEATALHETGHK